MLKEKYEEIARMKEKLTEFEMYVIEYIKKKNTEEWKKRTLEWH